MPRLVIKFPQQKSLVFPLVFGENLIGRGDDCRLRLPSVSVSRQHCRILVGKQNVNIEDMDSQNGILVNGKAVKQHTMKSGDEIQVGSFMLWPG
jgi:pSer/pThr/pTyr-binding forkhead associated (FHA) protein